MIEFPIQFTLTYLCFLRCVARARPRSYAGGTGHHIVDYDEPQMSPFQQRSSLSQGQKASPAPLDLDVRKGKVVTRRMLEQQQQQREDDMFAAMVTPISHGQRQHIDPTSQAGRNNVGDEEDDTRHGNVGVGRAKGLDDDERAQQFANILSVADQAFSSGTASKETTYQDTEMDDGGRDSDVQQSRNTDHEYTEEDDELERRQSEYQAGIMQKETIQRVPTDVDGCDRDVQSDDGLWPNGISPPAITNQLVPPSFSEQPSTSPSDAVDVSAMAHHDEYISVAHDDSETEQGGNEGAFQRDGDSMHDQQHGASGDGGVRGSSREGSDHQSHGHGAGDDVPSQLQAVARSETDPEQGQNIADCEPDDEEVATALSFVHQSQQARPFLKFGFDTPGHSSPNTVATSSVGWRSSTSSIATDISEAEAAARPFHVIKAIADSLTSSDLVIPLCASFVTEEEWSDHPHRGSDSPPLNVDVMVSTQREALPNDSAPVAALCSSTRPDLFL
eukprot:m.143341 g.143341  ORF g.143341 m.143341 type:complete len:503 (-) comp14088_c0_seq9:106-1614(-)